MPWVAAVPAIASAAAGIWGGISGARAKRKEAERQRQFYRWLYDPSRINKSAGQLNPFLAYAMGLPGGGQFANGQNNFANDLRKIAQGQDLSKYLLNQPLHEINRGADQNLAKFQNLVGRNGLEGGLANFYGMSNLAGRNINRARTMRDYGLWRENQRRTDINNLLGQWAQTQGMVTQNGANMAQGMPAFTSGSAWGQAAPALAQAASDIFRAFQQPGSGNPQGGQGSTIQTGGSNNQFANSFGQSGNWFQGGYR